MILIWLHYVERSSPKKAKIFEEMIMLKNKDLKLKRFALDK